MTIDQAIDVYLRADARPEYPDDTTGQTYFQNAWATVDGYVGTGAVLSVAGGALVVSSTSVGAELITRTAAQTASSTVMLRVRKTTGSITSVGLSSNLGATGLTFVPTASWQVFTLTPSTNWTGSLTSVIFNLIGQSADCVLEFDWIYIGNGVWLERFMQYLGGGGAPTLTTGRLFWMQAPEGVTLPYAVATVVSDSDMQEFFNVPDAGQGRVQLDIVSADKSGKDIALKARDLLRHYRGSMNGLTVNVIWPINRWERFEVNTHRFIFSADYEVHCEY